MKSVKNIKQLIKKFHVTTNAKMDQKVNKDVLEVIRKFKKTQSALTQPNIWRIIMTNRKIQLTTAVTVILIISLFLYFSDTSIVRNFSTRLTIFI
jgi:hypothetical protein